MSHLIFNSIKFSAVIFSRLDPEDKLVIGCRKATYSAETSSLPNPIIDIARNCTENGNQPTVSAYSSLVEFCSFFFISVFPFICGHFISLLLIKVTFLVKNMEHEGTSNCDSLQQPAIQEKKKMRNIGSKSKRLHMNSEEAMELKFTWEEAQDFLRPPPSKPTVFVIEDCELEEYDVSIHSKFYF